MVLIISYTNYHECVANNLKSHCILAAGYILTKNAVALIKFFNRLRILQQLGLQCRGQRLLLHRAEKRIIRKKNRYYFLFYETNGYFCTKVSNNMAIEIKAIPTLKGKDAKKFIERADEVERKFKGFDGIENSPAFKAMQNILRKSGMLR